MTSSLRPASVLFSLALAAAALSTSAFAQAPAPKAAASKPAAAASKPAAAPAPQVRRATFEPSIQAKPAAPKEKLLTREELKACFARQMKNEAEATAIKSDQEAYKKDYEGIVSAQAELTKQQATNRATQTELSTERGAISNASTELQAKALANAKPSEDDKKAWEAERAVLVERAKVLDDKITAFNNAVQSLRDRSKEVDARVPGINERQKSINGRVEALQAELKTWREECADKAYDEADEAVVKKELGMK